MLEKTTYVLAPVSGVELRDAGLATVLASGLRVLHAAEHDRVQRGAGAQEEIAFGLAQRAQRAEHELVLEVAHPVERARVLAKHVVLAGGKIAHQVNRIGQFFRRSSRHSPRQERLATALRSDVLVLPVRVELRLRKEFVALPCNVVLAEDVCGKGDKEDKSAKTIRKRSGKKICTP